MRRPSIRTALAGAATAAVVLLGAGGLAAAGTARISSDAQAVAALDRARAEIDAVRSYVAGKPSTPPTTSTPSKPPTTTTPPPSSGDQQTAAGRLGWGTPVAAGSDEFNGTGVDRSKWVLPDGCFAGHAGNGRRCAANSTVANGVLTQTGEANGDTGWMQSRHNSYRGRWETRMRVTDRNPNYSTVALLWPVAEDFPRGGEVDYAETGTTANAISFFLHYGASNSQTTARKAIDLTQFHNYAVQWGDSCVIGYIDSQEWFRDCVASHQPPRAMKVALQLDYFPSNGPAGQARTQTDWHRFYPAP